MENPICPTCGCSLVRLCISKDKAVSYSYNSKEYSFCCNGCIELFVNEPGKYIREINRLVVCPVCLGEKLIESTIKSVYEGKDFHFCRCPHCIEEFNKNPEYFVNRLEGI